MTQPHPTRKSITSSRTKNMKIILHLAFLICIVSSGCNKSSNDVSQQDKSRSEKNSTEIASSMDSSENHQRTTDTINKDSDINPKTIVAENISSGLAQSVLKNAKIVRRKLKAAEKFGLEEINKINRSINDKPILVADDDLQIKSPDEAFERINISLSMASPPEVFGEDESYYYFSGGVSVGRIDDFSSGIRISKSGGAIHIWQRRE